MNTYTITPVHIRGYKGPKIIVQTDSEEAAYKEAGKLSELRKRFPHKWSLSNIYSKVTSEAGRGRKYTSSLHVRDGVGSGYKAQIIREPMNGRKVAKRAGAK